MMEFRFRDADENSRATDAEASALHDGLESSQLEALPGVVDGFLVGVGSDEHVIILVSLRSLHEGWKIFLPQSISQRQRVGFPGESGHLQVNANVFVSGGADSRLA